MPQLFDFLRQGQNVDPRSRFGIKRPTGNFPGPPDRRPWPIPEGPRIPIPQDPEGPRIPDPISRPSPRPPIPRPPRPAPSPMPSPDPGLNLSSYSSPEPTTSASNRDATGRGARPENEYVGQLLEDFRLDPRQGNIYNLFLEDYLNNRGGLMRERERLNQGIDSFLTGAHDLDFNSLYDSRTGVNPTAPAPRPPIYNQYNIPQDWSQYLFEPDKQRYDIQYGTATPDGGYVGPPPAERAPVPPGRSTNS